MSVVVFVSFPHCEGPCCCRRCPLLCSLFSCGRRPRKGPRRIRAGVVFRGPSLPVWGHVRSLVPLVSAGWRPVRAMAGPGRRGCECAVTPLGAVTDPVVEEVSSLRKSHNLRIFANSGVLITTEVLPVLVNQGQLSLESSQRCGSSHRRGILSTWEFSPPRGVCHRFGGPCRPGVLSSSGDFDHPVVLITLEFSSLHVSHHRKTSHQVESSSWSHHFGGGFISLGLISSGCHHLWGPHHISGIPITSRKFPSPQEI